MPSNLLTSLYIPSERVRHLLALLLEKGSFIVQWNTTEKEFLSWTGRNRHRIDCLILQNSPQLTSILERLKGLGILLPTIVIAAETDSLPLGENGEVPSDEQALEHCTLVAGAYHPAVACLTSADLDQLEQYVHQAIDQFLKLPTVHASTEAASSEEDTQYFVLSLQQQRLTEKLKERLGYLGVYYKRNPEHFLRSMSQAEREDFLQKLRADYRTIILKYFANDTSLNQRIDDFVNTAFFADISVSHIVEIHMELMDDFANQLKLEGRSEEILLDYRLTLIDVIAHLCEMYRRSIPREP